MYILLQYLTLIKGTIYETEDNSGKRYYSRKKKLSLTHSHFLLMGGFAIKVAYSPQDPDYLHVITPDDLGKSLVRGSVAEKPTKSYRLPPRHAILVRDLIADVDITRMRDRSKSDGLCKALAILQAGWFGMSIIARALTGLALTELEIVTMAFSFVSFTLCILWWDKPRGVQSRILLHPELKLNQGVKGRRSNSFFEKTFDVMQLSDSGVSFLVMPCVIGLGFGAMHCIAWNFVFPSLTERLLWHISAVVAALGPTISTVSAGVLTLSCGMTLSNQVPGIPALIIIFVITLLFFLAYVIARMALFILPLMAMRAIPYAAYQAVPWLSNIPHL
jgi:hypothetical protein